MTSHMNASWGQPLRVLSLFAALAGAGWLFAEEPESARKGASNAAEEKAHGKAHPAASKIDEAVAVLVPVGGSKVQGMVRFKKQGDGVQIRGNVRGLTPGKHGFHIHQYGDLSDHKTGESAGGHFNPSNEPHGRREDSKRHVGDLGNIEADADGTAQIRIDGAHLTIDGPHGILGRALVVHAKEDQFTQPSGDAGDRVAIGVIGVANPEAAMKKMP